MLSNHTPSGGGLRDAGCLFQSYFEVDVAEDGGTEFAALPGTAASDSTGESLRLIYREARTFAVGHGCAADWRSDRSSVKAVIATSFPGFEVGSMTPDLRDDVGEPLTVPMGELAGLVTSPDQFAQLDRVVESYGAWIRGLELEAASLDETERVQAKLHIERAREAEVRMREGIDLLRTDPQVRRAFELANHAMLLQQVQTNKEPRSVTVGRGAPNFTPPYAAPNVAVPPRGRGNWRPFQIGFLLASLASTGFRDHEDRELVDLIWFPTGGGKTEAYLGLTAFSAFLRRIRAPGDSGTDTLMRYTLRLLTAQQYERAAALICSMDVIRMDRVDELGSAPFSIGLWVGGGTTSNNWTDAKSALRKLADPKRRRSAPNPFLVTRCPWCGCEMGPRAHRPYVLGYHLEQNKRVVFRCPDPACPFHEGLPLHVVDEDLYESRPTLVIGTVDKFARLSWSERPRSLFGLGEDGHRELPPPNLIIQDELHLISGPLGTMVGHFEVLVERLCQGGTGGDRKPKIVCSTATVRNYEDQIRWLFGRPRSRVFPPPGVDVDDSFFGIRARSADGRPAPGRLYVGLYAPVLGSHMNVQIRAYAAVLQAAMGLPERERDAYWTLMGFFNSLRDLGSTTTLLRDQIQGHLTIMWTRAGLRREDRRDARRTIHEVIELTSRLRSEEVPAALARLSTPYEGEKSTAVDTCLASSMIEVGIDVERLGLMVVTGQPKTTSQYIQVTGRVGRRWWDRPGLVVVVYAPSRARDRSVFEGFRAFHERLYAAVEPTSVTPFALPTLNRAMHGVLVGYARQLLDTRELASPTDVNLDDLHEFLEVLRERSRVVDPGAEEMVADQFDKLLRQWELRAPTRWENWQDPDDSNVLQVSASSAAGREREGGPWRTPNSMRNVDAECVIDTRIAQDIEAAS